MSSVGTFCARTSSHIDAKLLQTACAATQTKTIRLGPSMPAAEVITPISILTLQMSGKRKRGEEIVARDATSAKPLTAIAAARLRTEATAKVVKTPEVTLEQISVPESPLLEAQEPEHQDSDTDEENVPVQRNLKLCNWRNDPQNIISETDTELTINLNKHATIALVGCFEFTVLRGAIHINGANIGTVGRDGQKNKVYRAFVPATSPIFKIRGLDGTNHVMFQSCSVPAPLSVINPLFDDIWCTDLQTQGRKTFNVVSASPYRQTYWIQSVNPTHPRSTS